MLSRRLIRIKVMQALYAYYQSEPRDSYKSEKSLFTSIEKVYEAFIYQLLFITELSECARMAQAENANKQIQAGSVNHNKFIENTTVAALNSNTALIQKAKQLKLSWQKEFDLVQQTFNKLRKTEEYKGYVNGTDNRSDIDFALWCIKKFIGNDEIINTHLEERYIYWSDDKDFVTSMIVKTLKTLDEKASPNTSLPDLYKDEEDDVKFTKDLFKKTVSNDQEYEEAISAKASNWESERIALTDMILMKLCMAEITTFSQIPIKVSINEYLDIAKNYSTPKSNIFINGIIDKLVIEWKADGKIVKTGRGLIEN